MSRILLVDTVGDTLPVLRPALEAAGFAVVAEKALDCCVTPADAIVLATDAASLAAAFPQVQAVREASGTPVVVVADLDRSGWDRTFSSPEALSADALLDRPVDPDALLGRLRGILAARRQAESLGAEPEMASVIDRAIANEEAAAAFYRRAAETVSRPDTREALQSLTRDEEEHRRLLEEFRSGARPLPEGASRGGTLVEALGTPAFTAEMTPADAFLLAANKERLAVEMYQNWGRLYPEGPERELLMKLAEVERRHKERVEAMFSNAAFPEVW